MKRRKFFRTVAAAPLAPTLLAQQTAPANNNPAPTSPAPPALDPAVPPAPLNRTPTAAAAPTRIETAVADEVADTSPKFFNATQFATLRQLSVTIMPPMNGTPGALEAGAPEFLDFLISESPRERQQLYSKGLDQLNAESKKKFSKNFADADASEIATLLAPLKQPWTYESPTDTLAAFLREAKKDVRTATLNSKEYSLAAGRSGGRRGGNVGLYWYPID